MKKFLTLFTLSLVALAFSAQTAQAKRFGMGGSYGYQKKVAPKQYGQASKAKTAPQSTQPKANQPAGAQAAQSARQTSGASRWLGPLAGIAAGGLLAAMLFGDGFENIQIMDILIFALIAFLLFKLFVRRRNAVAETPQASETIMASAAKDEKQQYFQASEPPSNAHKVGIANNNGSIIGSALSEQAEPVDAVPSWFDEESFLAAAKHNFELVQKAWDQGDLTEIASYCSAELFEQLKTQIQPNVHHTEVDTLYAEIADMAVEADHLIVSVRFNGFIKEDGDLHAFNEIWHLSRPLDASENWKIIGIQPGQSH